MLQIIAGDKNNIEYWCDAFGEFYRCGSCDLFIRVDFRGRLACTTP
jgi:hypothetical protein